MNCHASLKNQQAQKCSKMKEGENKNTFFNF